MSHIEIRRKHGLPHDLAMKAVDDLAARLKDDYAVACRWEGSTLHFQRAGLTGTLRVDVGEVAVDVKLGFLLSSMRDKIAKAIERSLDAELGVKPVTLQGR